ncbi:MAG: hypothetical protein R3C10_23920 [Pirellulales bacterium]
MPYEARSRFFYCPYGGMPDRVHSLGVDRRGCAPLDPNAFTSLGTLDLASGSLTFDTDALTVSGAFSGTGVLKAQGIGIPDIAVFTFDAVTIADGVTLSFVGTRPMRFVAG